MIGFLNYLQFSVSSLEKFEEFVRSIRYGDFGRLSNSVEALECPDLMFEFLVEAGVKYGHTSIWFELMDFYYHEIEQKILYLNKMSYALLTHPYVTPKMINQFLVLVISVDFEDDCDDKTDEDKEDLWRFKTPLAVNEHLTTQHKVDVFLQFGYPVTMYTLDVKKIEDDVPWSKMSINFDDVVPIPGLDF